MKISIDSDARDVAQLYAEAPRRLLEMLDRMLGRTAIVVQNSAKLAAPKASSELTNAIQRYRLKALEHVVVAAKQYGAYVEIGTRSGGTAPISALMEWIKKKGIVPRTPGMSSEGLAKVIQRKIARSGTPAQPFMAPSLWAQQSNLMQLVSRGVSDELARL